jgi:YHS domain-containing protein
MAVDVRSAPTSVYKDQTHYFCSRDHKTQFDAAPAKFIAD